MAKDTGKKLADMLYGGNPEQAAFGVFPQMKGKRSKQDPQAAKNVPVDLLRGAVSGVLGAPGDIESLIRLLPGLDERTILPTSEEIEGRLPFKSDTPVSRAATGLGQLGGGFYTGPGSPFRLVGAIPSAVKRAGQDFAMAAAESGPKIFVGPKSKTWHPGRAAMAEAMEQSGRSPEDIWQATGTFRGRDGILRQEIDDRAARLILPDEQKDRVEALKGKVGEMKERLKPTPQKDLFPKALTEAKKGVRSDIEALKQEISGRGKNPRTQGLDAQYAFEHPELYEAYPELRGLNITMGGREGTSEGASGALTVSQRSGSTPGYMEMDMYNRGLMSKNPTSVALHEMQHAVQTLEGMGPGGSPTMAFNDPVAHEILKRRLDEIRSPGTFEEFQRANRFPEDKAREAYDEYVKTYKPFINPKIEREVQKSAAMEYYKRLAGEAEARAAQERQLMTPAQRLETPPPASYDVPQEDLIVKPPREFADGGRVHFSDNPDAMQLELAGGGLVKGLAKLARAAPKTAEEIKALAERMAPQVTGEYVRESAKSAKTVAGKTKKQFERERDLPVDVRAIKEERIPQPVDIEKLKGDVMIGIPGDPTITGKSLYSVGDVRLGSPSPQHGGPLYGLYHDDDHFWASGLGAARRVQNLAKEAAEQYDAPVVGKYIMMGPESINYAQHFADANLQAIDLSKMTKRQIEGFDRLIRQGSPASGPRPSFPGIEDKESAYLHMAIDPELRKHFNDLMQKNTVTEAFNLPSGHDIRYAITEPALRDLETGVTGYSMGRMRPDIPASELRLSEHPTYSHDIPGHFLGSSRYPTPYELSFPDTLKAIRENPKQAPHEFGSLKMVGPRQTIDQQLIDELRMYEERMKELTGKAAGGEVHGLSSQDMLFLQSQDDISKLPADAQRERITNMGGQELRQRMASKYAGGGDISADDLILEERKL